MKLGEHFRMQDKQINKNDFNLFIIRNKIVNFNVTTDLKII